MHFETRRLKSRNECAVLSVPATRQLIRADSHHIQSHITGSFTDFQVKSSYHQRDSSCTKANHRLRATGRHLHRSSGRPGKHRIWKITSFCCLVGQSDEADLTFYESTSSGIETSPEMVNEEASSYLESPICNRTRLVMPRCEQKEEQLNPVRRTQTKVNANLDPTSGLFNSRLLHNFSADRSRDNSRKLEPVPETARPAKSRLTNTNGTSPASDRTVKQSAEIFRQYHQAIMDEMNSLFNETISETNTDPTETVYCTKLFLARLTTESHRDKWRSNACDIKQSNLNEVHGSTDAHRAVDQEQQITASEPSSPSGNHEVSGCQGAWCTREQLDQLREDLIHHLRVELNTAKCEIIQHFNKTVDPLIKSFRTSL